MHVLGPSSMQQRHSVFFGKACKAAMHLLLTFDAIKAGASLEMQYQGNAVHKAVLHWNELKHQDCSSSYRE